MIIIKTRDKKEKKNLPPQKIENKKEKIKVKREREKGKTKNMVNIIFGSP